MAANQVASADSSIVGCGKVEAILCKLPTTMLKIM